MVSCRSSMMTSTTSVQGIAPGSSTSTSTSPAAIPQRVVLPLSSSLLDLVPNHPILHTLSRPILPRIAHLESLVLKSPPSRVLQRIVGLSPWTIVLLANVGLVAMLTRWREQWRVMLTFVGVAEAVTKTFKVLDRLDRERDRDDDLLALDHDYNQDVADLDTVARQELRQKRIDSCRRELKHVLSFWLLFALLGAIESVRASASTVPLSTRLAPLTRSLKSLLRRLALRYPNSLPRIPDKFISASLSSNPSVTQKRRPFPQPRRHVPKISTLTTPSLPVVLFNSEPRYRIFKLLVLWQGLRRDGFGASVLWDWFIGPIFGAYHRRRSAQALEKDPNGLPKIPCRRVINLVVSEEEEEAYLKGTASGSSRSTMILDQAFEPPLFSSSRHKGSQSTTSSSASSSTATSPSFYRRSGAGGGGGGNHFNDYETGEGDESYDSVTSSSSPDGSTAFPTPDVPFRLTSSSHPIQARSHSFPGSTSSTYLTRSGSPSPAARGFGGYEVGNGSALGAKWTD
ncbi:BQ2448_2498 [Microbotryum intermedium]|uniref:BQ2448_2498 protein n=1 Tax=Microbotryum intermedium TaxID=269621 RepID=A0A238FEC1_9BASI|nr:BQ2448_2498 [Microbotryum intermedium]